MENAWLHVRQAGAEARERLISAAARRWGVATSACRTENGEVHHTPTGRRFDYGVLAADGGNAATAARIAAQESQAAFSIIGKPTARLDIPTISRPAPSSAMDVGVTGMRSATVLLAPRLGAEPTRIDDSAAEAVPGVRDIVPIHDGSVIVADDRGRRCAAVRRSS